MPIRVTDSNGIKKVVLKDEEIKSLSQLMTELKFNNVDFMITKMVIYDWPQADVPVVSDNNHNGGDHDDNNNAIPDEKEDNKEDNKESLEELENNRYLNRLSKWRHLIKKDNFCYRYAVNTCYKQNENKGCKSLINVFRKHGKSFNINQLYKNGNTTNIKNKRRAFYLSHYLKDYCGMENSYVINNFNKQIINDKDYNLLKIHYKNTSLGKKEKRMRRKKNGKKNVQIGNANGNDNKTTLDNNNIHSSLMTAQNAQSLNEINVDNKLSNVLLIASTTNTSTQDDVSSVTVSDNNSVTNTSTNTDDRTSNGDSFH